MIMSQRFRRFAIPFRVPFLFSPKMTRITTVETSSREGKQCPHMGSFNLWNKSKSGGLTSELYGAWGNTSHSYLLNKSVTTFPRCGHAMSWKWVAHPWASQVSFCALFASNHDNMLLSHLFLMEFCHDDTSVIKSKDHHLLDLWLHSLKFFGSRGRWTSPLVWLRFQLQFKVSNPRFVNSDNLIQECLTFNVKSLFQ